MKIYLASRFRNQAILRAVRARLRELGHTVTARWLDGHDVGEYRKLAADWAEEDLADIRACDLLIAYTHDCQKTRGGMNFEMGYAIGQEKRVWLVGDPVCVFHFHPMVICRDFPTWNECFTLLQEGFSL